jgi:Leucine-rich repeat (LRR) protein
MLSSFELHLPLVTPLHIGGDLLAKFGPPCPFQSLLTLDISYNHINTRPNLYAMCPGLTVANLSSNFPCALSLQPQLLDISNNELVRCADSLSPRDGLTSLDLRKNPSTELPVLPPHLQVLMIGTISLEIVHAFPQLSLKSLHFTHAQFSHLL